MVQIRAAFLGPRPSALGPTKTFLGPRPSALGTGWAFLGPWPSALGSGREGGRRVTFTSTPYLWLLALVPFALALFLGAERARVVAARRFMSERLRGVAVPARVLRPWLLTVALVLLVVAL